MSKTIDQLLRNPAPIPFTISIDLIDRLAPLDISESSVWFTDLVAARVAQTGKHIDDMTVREAREIIEDCKIATRKSAKRHCYWWKQ